MQTMCQSSLVCPHRSALIHNLYCLMASLWCRAYSFTAFIHLRAQTSCTRKIPDLSWPGCRALHICKPHASDCMDRSAAQRLLATLWYCAGWHNACDLACCHWLQAPMQGWPGLQLLLLIRLMHFCPLKARISGASGPHDGISTASLSPERC